MRRTSLAAGVLLAVVAGAIFGAASPRGAAPRVERDAAHTIVFAASAPQSVSVAATTTTRSSPSTLPWATLATNAALLSAFALWFRARRRHLVNGWHAESLLRLRGPPLAS